MDGCGSASSDDPPACCCCPQILSSEPNREAITPYVKVFSTLARWVVSPHACMRAGLPPACTLHGGGPPRSNGRRRWHLRIPSQSLVIAQGARGELRASADSPGIHSCVRVPFLCRRRPFLIRGLENTLIKLLLTTEFFDEANRKKIGIGERPTGVGRGPSGGGGGSRALRGGMQSHQGGGEAEHA